MDFSTCVLRGPAIIFPISVLVFADTDNTLLGRVPSILGNVYCTAHRPLVFFFCFVSGTKKQTAQNWIAALLHGTATATASRHGLSCVVLQEKEEGWKQDLHEGLLGARCCAKEITCMLSLNPHIPEN